MKKSISAILGVMLTLVVVVAGALAFPVDLKASEMTFTGKIDDRTTAEKMYLSTSGGTVEIKIDDSTDNSEAKFFFPGTKVTVTCSTGSDGYWHATSIKSEVKPGKAEVDSAKATTVKGKIAKGTTREKIYLKSGDGTMEIKLDNETDLSGVKCIMVGREVEVNCARGSDAYMHALSVKDKMTSALSTANVEKYGAGVRGTISGQTTSSKLVLKTSEGRMEFVIDSNTDASEGRVVFPGQKYTVYFYRGNDSWNHASKIVNESDTSSPTVSVDERSKATVNGKIKSKTNESTLFLQTKDGTMEIRLDANTVYNNCLFLLEDKRIVVTLATGSDGYNHAVSISPEW
ncbi:MAG: hypothetical protein K6A61_05490 [Butyrivibrio sp.]|nr:hypothetical protein [Butyrivibrio sp.]